MQNMFRFFVADTRERPIEIITRSNAVGYYINDGDSGLIISKQDLTDTFGIYDTELLNLFGDDGYVFENEGDAKKVALALKNSI